MDRYLKRIPKDKREFTGILQQLGLPEPDSISCFAEQYEGEENREYDVYLLEWPDQCCILKKTDDREVLNYTRYLTGGNFSVPKYFGWMEEGENRWILLEYIDGEDLSRITDELVLSAAEALAEIQNAGTWEEEIDRERFNAYYARLQKRAKCLDGLPDFQKVYDLFLERQYTAPRRISHGDLGQFNAIARNGKVVLIDWGFGGILPYSLDIARFIAHTSENGEPFGMYMTDRQKKLFVDAVYEKLNEKPPFDVYLRDIRLALLNEYVEFLEGMGLENRWYFDRASAIVREILDK